MTMTQLPEGIMDGVEDQIFAIGDIHGELDALHVALHEISSRRDPDRKSHLIFLGDLIDRGDDGLQCMIDAWNARDITGVDKVTVLMGNHEMMMFSSLYTDFDPALWVMNGGSAVLNEIKRLSPTPVKTNSDFIEAAKAILPEDLITHMKATSHVQLGKLMFVHAGIAPWIETEDEMAAYLGETWDMTKSTENHNWGWIREPFLERTKGHGPNNDLVVVHGHSPVVMDPASYCVSALSTGTRPTKDEIYEVLMEKECYDMLGTHSRINLDGGCGKLLAPVPILELKDNQYEITVTKGMKYESENTLSA